MHIPLKKKKEENTFEEDDQTQETVKEQQLDEIRSVIKFEETKQPEEKTSEKNQNEPTQSEKTATEKKETPAPSPSQPTTELPDNYIKTIRTHEEEINKLAKTVEQLALDLDDLVSLYEIVSEQMNPFVGLSKVTKKRLDTLENFIAEIETLKTRMDDFETQYQKTISTQPTFTQQKAPTARPNINPPKATKNPEISSDEFDLLFNETLDIITEKKNVDEALQELLEQKLSNQQEDTA